MGTFVLIPLLTTNAGNWVYPVNLWVTISVYIIPFISSVISLGFNKNH